MNIQKEMTIFSAVPEIVFLPQSDIERCKNMDEAIAMCILKCPIKYKQSTLADMLEIDKGQLSKILNGKGYNYPPRKLARLVIVCRNYAPLQFLIGELGFNTEVMGLLKKLAA